MALLPKSTPLENLSLSLNVDTTESELRNHLGLSGIGNVCHRALQFQHYWAYTTEHSARILRLFNVGHDAEPKIIADLKTQGWSVYADQAEVVGIAGHWKGHIDGECDHPDFNDGKTMLIEFKTHNDKSFNDLKKKAVKVSKPGHYAQMQAYMGYRVRDCGLYVAINKNTSEYYFEIIPFDMDAFSDIIEKQSEVLMSEVLLPRIGTGTPSWFECKFCDAKDVCYHRAEPHVNCRSCEHVDVLDDGKWRCTFAKHSAKGKYLTIGEQRAACDGYMANLIFKE